MGSRSGASTGSDCMLVTSRRVQVKVHVHVHVQDMQSNELLGLQLPRVKNESRAHREKQSLARYSETLEMSSGMQGMAEGCLSRDQASRVAWGNRRRDCKFGWTFAPVWFNREYCCVVDTGVVQLPFLLRSSRPRRTSNCCRDEVRRPRNRESPTTNIRFRHPPAKVAKPARPCCLGGTEWTGSGPVWIYILCASLCEFCWGVLVAWQETENSKV